MFGLSNPGGSLPAKCCTYSVNSAFVIAEFSFNNRNVYFEAGYARGLGKEVFHVLQEGHVSGDEMEGKKVHFDIQQILYKTWTTTAELEEKLASWIEAAVGRFEESKN
jgi:hypothetical protein